MAKFEDLIEFQERFSGIVNETPTLLDRNLMETRMKHVVEEVMECWDGVMDDSIPEIADALVDIVYVAMGTAALMGLPWDELWADVHRANMLKIPMATERSPLDAVKPAGWEGPRTEEIIERACLNDK